jgi:hypothetical protein
MIERAHTPSWRLSDPRRARRAPSRRALRVLLGGLLALAACDCTPERGPVVSSETHFLQTCTDHCDGGLECVCGVCTRPCETASSCHDLDPKAECLNACSDSEVPQVCELPCKDDSDCRSSGSTLSCESGVCRANGTPAGGASSRDAGGVSGSSGAPTSNSAGAGAAPTNAAGGSSGTAGIDSPRGFCEAYFRVAADYEARCTRLTSEIWLDLYGPEERCAIVDDAVASGRLTYSAKDGQACIDAFESTLSSDCTAAKTMAPELPETCGTGLAPAVPLGGACRSYQLIDSFEECSDGNFCSHQPTTSCFGTCRAYLTNGDACERSGPDRCPKGDVCFNGVCTTLAGLDEACGGPDLPGCASDFYCQGATTTTSGVCVARKDSGACTESDECDTFHYCSPEGECATPKASGEDCTPGLGECVAAMSYCKAGKCAGSLPAAGEPCGDIDGEQAICAEGYCDLGGNASGTCRAPLEPGQPCTGANAGECGGDNGHCDETTKLCVSCD